MTSRAKDILNAWLAKAGIKKPGNIKNGESTIEAVITVAKGQFFTDISFRDRVPSGDRREFTIRFHEPGGAADGAIIMVRIGEKFLIIDQWRKCGRWTHEIPRGFPTSEMGDGLALSILANDIGARAMNLIHVKHVECLGTIDENTGTSVVAPHLFFVEAEADTELLLGLHHKNDPTKLRLWSAERIWKELGNGLRDNHSISAVTIVFKYLGLMHCSG